MYVLILAAAVGAGDLPPPRPPAPAYAPPAKPWLRLDTERVAAGTIEKRYRELRLAQLRDAPSAAGDSPESRLGREGFLPQLEFLAVEDTSTQRWTFAAGPNGKPTRATVWTNGVGPSYSMHARVLCEDTAALCESYRREVAAVPAPAPVTAGVSGGPHDSSRQLGWIETFQTEQCARRPVRMEEPKYPATALREGLEGQADVVIYTNPCGEVRFAQLVMSSRNRDLDRAAIAAVRQWVVDAESVTPVGSAARVPIKFVLSPDLPVPQAGP